MTQHEITCRLDGSTKTERDCYFGVCSNDVYFECFPEKASSYKTAQPIKTYDPPNKHR